MTKLEKGRLEERLFELQNELHIMEFKASYNGSLSIIDDIHDTICRIDEIEMKLMEVAK